MMVVLLVDVVRWGHGVVTGGGQPPVVPPPRRGVTTGVLTEICGLAALHLRVVVVLVAAVVN